MHGKHTAAYWRDKVEKHRRNVQGKSFEDDEYSVRIMFDRRRERFPLHTSIRDEAAQKAAAIYLELCARGWAPVLATHKAPKLAPQAHTVPAAAVAPVTVGQVIEAATRLSSARPESKEFYAVALRRIVAGVFSIEGGYKHGPMAAHFAEWRAKVDAVPFAELTPARVLAWKNRYLEKATLAGKDSAAVSVNSFLANARSLFSRKVLPFLRQELDLPSPLFFEGIIREKQPSPRYRSRIDAAELLRAAQEELATADPESFKVLLLCLVFGLRRSEADTLLWSQFDFDRRLLRIEDTEARRLKSRDSAGDVDMDPETCAIFRGFHARAKDRRFVLEEGERSVPRGKTCRYRSDSTQRRLLSWLRGKGVTDRKPIHTLRKEIGSIIASRDGIFAASRYLRHADIQTTARFYADKKTPVTAGLGAILGHAAGKVVPADFGSPSNEPITAAEAEALPGNSVAK